MFHPLPVSPSPTGRYPMDTVSGDLAVSSRSHLTPPQRSCLHSPCTLSGPIAIHCPPPCRGRAEAAERPGGGGVPAKTVQRLRQETGEGDVPPPPCQPHPRGVISHRCTAGDLAVSSRSHLTPPKDPASTPRALYPGQSPFTARPLVGGGRRPRERPGGGGVPAKTVSG